MDRTARLLSTAEVDAVVSYRLVGLYDCESYEDVPTPRTVGHPWVSVGTSRVLMESEADVGGARFQFELWDAEPLPLDGLIWPRSELIQLHLPSGRLGVFEFMGFKKDVFNVGLPGHYHVRLGWRVGERDAERKMPEAFALAQFWVCALTG